MITEQGKQTFHQPLEPLEVAKFPRLSLPKSAIAEMSKLQNRYSTHGLCNILESFECQNLDLRRWYRLQGSRTRHHLNMLSFKVLPHSQTRQSSFAMVDHALASGKSIVDWSSGEAVRRVQHQSRRLMLPDP